MALFYPDFELKWAMYTDASDAAVAGILYQIRVLPDGTLQYQPLAW